MQKFFKGKKAGFYLMIADAILALIFGIIFFATYKSSMANNASAHVPEVIGICAILSFAIEAVALAVPEHKWVHVGALLAICFSLMKEIYLIPNLIADQINKVEFQGGNFPMNVFYLVTLVIIVVISIVASFMEVVEKEEPIKWNKPNAIRYGVSGGVVLVASLVSIIVVSNLRNTMSHQVAKNNFNVAEEFKDRVIPYDFDPLSVKYTKSNNPWAEADANTIKNETGDKSYRPGHFLVYQFEGFYAEGYQGNYSKTYANLYLWDDGLYNGVQNNSNIYGYWYNQEDTGEDCLAMIDTRGTECDMICTKSSSKFYDWITDVKTSLNGGRSIKVNGYYYYPAIGMYIDTGSDDLKYEWGEDIDTTQWTVMQVRNDLRYGPVFDPDQNVYWTLPSSKDAGTHEVKAIWEYFIAKVNIEVGEDMANYILDATGDTVKKTYRYVDRFDPTGLVVKRITDKGEKEVDISELPYEMDVANGKINFTTPNNKILSYDVTFDTSEAANTITGEVNGKQMKFVVTGYDKMTATIDGQTIEVAIELSGSGLAGIKVLSLISGDEEVFKALPKNIGLQEQVPGTLTISLYRYFKSSTKANAYNQRTDTYFVFGPDNSFVDVLWVFDYQGLKNQEMSCKYVLDGDLKVGANITLTEVITDTNNQWTWSVKNFTFTEETTKEALAADLGFEPTLVE